MNRCLHTGGSACVRQTACLGHVQSSPLWYGVDLALRPQERGQLVASVEGSFQMLVLEGPLDFCRSNTLISHSRKQAQLGEVTSLFVTELGLQPSSPNIQKGVQDTALSPLELRKKSPSLISTLTTSWSTFPACQHLSKHVLSISHAQTLCWAPGSQK